MLTKWTRILEWSYLCHIISWKNYFGLAECNYKLASIKKVYLKPATDSAIQRNKWYIEKLKEEIKEDELDDIAEDWWVYIILFCVVFCGGVLRIIILSICVGFNYKQYKKQKKSNSILWHWKDNTVSIVEPSAHYQEYLLCRILYHLTTQKTLM